MQAIFWPKELIDTLNAEGFDVILLDNRDIGMTEHIDGARAPDPVSLVASRLAGRTLRVPYLLQDMADDSVALMDALEIPSAHIVGMSMGGMIVQSMAIRHPERVRSMCCWSTSTGQITDMMIAPQLIPMMIQKPSSDPEERLRNGVKMFQKIGTKRYPSDVDRLYEQVKLAASRSNGDVRGIPRQLAAILASPSRRPQLKRLKIPTLVIHGTQDPLQPLRGGEALARLIPKADFLKIKGYGHNLPAELMPLFGQRIAANIRRGTR